MNIFEFDSYKQFINAHIQSLPHQGRGEFRKISAQLRIHSTTVSQIFNGDKNLTLEQAADLCEYLHLDDLESEYFITLVQWERAGAVRLRKMLDGQKKRLFKAHQLLVNRIKSAAKFDSELQSQFYGNWQYSAVRVLSSIEGFQDIPNLAKRLNLDPKSVGSIVKFLVQTGLCTQEEGKIKPGFRKTHLDSDSPYINVHRTNWHLRAIEQFRNINEDSLVYSAPLSISSKNQAKSREILVNAIKEIGELAAVEEPTEAMILNVDWISF